MYNLPATASRMEPFLKVHLCKMHKTKKNEIKKK